MNADRIKEIMSLLMSDASNSTISKPTHAVILEERDRLVAVLRSKIPCQIVRYTYPHDQTSAGEHAIIVSYSADWVTGLASMLQYALAEHNAFIKDVQTSDYWKPAVRVIPNHNPHLDRPEPMYTLQLRHDAKHEV